MVSGQNKTRGVVWRLPSRGLNELRCRQNRWQGSKPRLAPKEKALFCRVRPWIVEKQNKMEPTCLVRTKQMDQRNRIQVVLMPLLMVSVRTRYMENHQIDSRGHFLPTPRQIDLDPWEQVLEKQMARLHWEMGNYMRSQRQRDLYLAHRQRDGKQIARQLTSKALGRRRLIFFSLDRSATIALRRKAWQAVYTDGKSPNVGKSTYYSKEPPPQDLKQGCLLTR